MHLDLKIQDLKSYMKILASKLYEAATNSRSLYIPRLVSDLLVHNRRVPNYHLILC